VECDDLGAVFRCGSSVSHLVTPSGARSRRAGPFPRALGGRTAPIARFRRAGGQRFAAE